jgi:hypothetical protein
MSKSEYPIVKKSVPTFDFIGVSTRKVILAIRAGIFYVLALVGPAEP